MSKLAALQRTTEARVPPVKESHRASTDAFLEHFERRLNAGIDAARQLQFNQPSDTLNGQIAYWKHAVKAIRWLRAMNKQRRRDA